MKTILFVYGSGGHREQSKRLLKNNKWPNQIIEMTEIGVTPILSTEKAHFIPEINSKYFGPLLSFPRTFFVSFYQGLITLMIMIRHKPDKVVSTGPLIGAVPLLMGRIFKKATIFIESWSRFSDSSKTGKLVKTFVNTVLYQNKEIASKYPNGKYSGRL